MRPPLRNCRLMIWLRIGLSFSRCEKTMQLSNSTTTATWARLKSLTMKTRERRMIMLSWLAKILWNHRKRVLRKGEDAVAVPSNPARKQLKNIRPFSSSREREVFMSPTNKPTDQSQPTSTTAKKMNFSTSF